VPDKRLQRLADVLVGYSTKVRPGDRVSIETSTLGVPLAREVYRAVVEAGGHPETRVTPPQLRELLYSEATDEQLDWLNPIALADVEHLDVRIVVEAFANTRAHSQVDPARHARRSRASGPILERILERAAAGELRWVLTLLPTTASAQEAEMSLAEYEDFVYAAGFLDRDDPVQEWETFAATLERLAGFLGARRTLRVIGADTDLTLDVGGRTWVPGSGGENFPDGEVFTGPVETSAEGTIRFSFPAIFGGREVDDVRLTFQGGKVVEVRAARGQAFLEEMLALDEGASRLGEFAFGMNDAVRQFTRNILFDEKLGGTVHLALGASYPESGGVNKSGLHWDMICDLREGSEVTADGEVVYRDGRFLPGVLD
jgi:aminopeptidase